MFPEESQQTSDAAGADDPQARQQLFAELYGDLRKLAQRELRRNGFALTLGATTLLH
jgi:hypothetical protein